MKTETFHAFMFGTAVVLAVVQPACSSEDASTQSADTKLALTAIASGQGTQLTCTSAEDHPYACHSASEGAYLLGLPDGEPARDDAPPLLMPPCFEGFARVIASDVCCSPNGDARPTCRGSTDAFQEQWGGPAGAHATRD